LNTDFTIYQEQNMRPMMIGLVTVLLTMTQASTFTQSGRANLATDVTAAEINTVLQNIAGGTDQQIKVVGMEKYNVGVGVLHRAATKTGAPIVAINHERVSEVYYVVSGTGTLLTGGTVTGAKPLPPDGYLVKVAVGPSNSGIFAQPAQSRKISAGDVVVIPPGVYHGFTDIPDHIDYVSVRVDPDKLLPSGHVHALLSKK
jgi:mannose-6-phosphate isomerase-like protein (cupin superfamily)